MQRRYASVRERNEMLAVELFQLMCHMLLYRNSSIPGGADRSSSPAVRLRTYIMFSALVGGLSAGVLVAYRTFVRPGSFGGPWMDWLVSGRSQ